MFRKPIYGRPRLLIICALAVTVVLLTMHQYDIIRDSVMKIKSNGAQAKLSGTPFTTPSMDRATGRPGSPSIAEQPQNSTVGCVSESTDSVLCTQEQRVTRIDEMCERYHGYHATQASQSAFVDGMTDDDIIKLSFHYFAVPEFQVMGCLNWKTGCTSWRQILYLNSIEKPPPHTEKDREEAKQDGRMKMLSKYPPAEIRTMLKTYFKFVTVRNPLSRLVSAYNDKVLMGHYGIALSTKIAKAVRNSTWTKEQQANKITFRQFLQYISEGGTDIMRPQDFGHWHTLTTRCQPCRLSYDHVVRVESMEQDARYIVHHKMRGRGEDLKRNVKLSKGKRPSSDFRNIHKEYADVPDELFLEMVDRYTEDMDLYGYNYTRDANDIVTATCSSGLNNGHTCC